MKWRKSETNGMEYMRGSYRGDCILNLKSSQVGYQLFIIDNHCPVTYAVGIAILKNLILTDCFIYRTTLAYSTSPNNMDAIQTRSQTAQSSLTINLNPQNIVLLNILRDNFGAQMETD